MTATQPLTVTAKEEPILQELVFLSLSALQPPGEEEPNNREPVGHRSLQTLQFAMPICLVPEDLNFN